MILDLSILSNDFTSFASFEPTGDFDFIGFAAADPVVIPGTVTAAGTSVTENTAPVGGTPGTAPAAGTTGTENIAPVTVIPAASILTTSQVPPAASELVVNGGPITPGTPAGTT